MLAHMPDLRYPNDISGISDRGDRLLVHTLRQLHLGSGVGENFSNLRRTRNQERNVI